MRQQRSGCGGLLSFLLLLCLSAVMLAWPRYLKTAGQQAPATLTAKHESIRIENGDWLRGFEIVAKFKPPGDPIERQAACSVDEQTFDFLHAGNSLSVEYLPHLLWQPLIPASRLSPCSLWPQINTNPMRMLGLATALAALLILLFLWRVLRFKMAGWALLLWGALLFTFVLMPQAEPAPGQPQSTQPQSGQPQSAQATIESVATIDKPMREHPYQIVCFKFVPAGMDDPVLAIDKLDLDSVPNLRPGQPVDIRYDATHPRTARIRGGSRAFPALARRTLLFTGLTAFGCLLAVALLSKLFRLRTRS